MKKRAGNIIVALIIVVVCTLIGSASYAADPIRIAVPTALQSDHGDDALKSEELGVEELNSKGGILVGSERRPIKLFKVDTKDMDPGTPVHDALLAVERVILQKKPHAILIGFGRSEALMAGMDLIAKHKIPYLGSYAQTHKFMERFSKDPEKYKHMFRVCTNSLVVPQTLKSSLDVLKNDYGLNRAYFMPADTLLGKAFVGVLREHCKETGWNEVGYEPIANDATDFSGVLSKIKEGNADVIVTQWDVAQSATIFLKQYQSMKVPSLIIGNIFGVASPHAWENIGPSVEYSIMTEGMASSIPVTPESADFIERYTKAFGLPNTQWFGGSAYDSVHILAQAIERAGSLEADKISTELEKTDFRGVSGRIRFSDNHQAIFGTDPNETAICLAYQWQDSEMIPIYPPSVAKGKVLLPPWMAE